ncbi:MAG TPA: glycosyltransferase [Desulfovibrio sp.]|uniref:glycosyltransferase family protein n=1 Tax=Desulfovibrio sp. TaxID=885 RepID=UPI002D4506AC|nr:glycosyltransferase [Desulfovibrio sp.]HZF61984.1 glycosyltransferase [Desulfovibrio sp.]
MADQDKRPQRVRLPDFTGRAVSLPDGPEAWTCRGEGDAVLLLGLGPKSGANLPQVLPLLADAPAVYWLESPLVARALEAWRLEAEILPREPLPAHWRAVTAEQAVALAGQCRRCIYSPGLRLDPDFWGPLLGRVDAALALPVSAARASAPKTAEGVRGPVLLPGDDGQLLHQELRTALAECGFGPVVDALPQPVSGMGGAQAGREDDFLPRWRDLLQGGKPAFLLSVNLRGLDADGRVFELCRALGIPVVLWFVDNPWHVLSGLRLPWWRDAHIFVTDAGFVDDLKAYGAGRVFHLPLAVAPHMWRDLPDFAPSSISIGPPLFVGRSAFPEKERFFAAASVPQALEAEAARLLEASTGPKDAPHFFWWHDKLGGSLWPGYDARRPGLGAERCAQANRRRWLFAAGAGKGGLRIIGDDGWKPLLPGMEILPPVDYYTALPEAYARAEAVLNVTSLLLPQSLSQRHFDVWASGGLLLSDATSGLEIFPAELTEPMTLRGPSDFMARCAWFQAHPQAAYDLRRAWRGHLREQHGYEQRIQQIIETFA